VSTALVNVFIIMEIHKFLIVIINIVVVIIILIFIF